MPLIDEGYLQAGIADVLFGTFNGAYDEQDFPISAGLLKASVEITPSRKALDMIAGLPQSLQKRICVEEGVNVKITVAETRLLLLYRFMGGGTYSIVAGGLQTVTAERKRLEGFGWHMLRGWNIALSPTPSINDGASTPSDYDAANFEFDRTRGRVRRTSGSVIPGDTESECVYNWTKPSVERIVSGGLQAMGYMPLQIHFVTDQSENREVWTIYRAYPKGEFTRAFVEDQFNVVSTEFDAAVDPTRTAGDQIFRCEAAIVS